DVVARLVVSSRTRFFVGEKWRDRSLAELVSELPLLLPQNDSTAREHIERLLADLALTPRSTVTSEYPGLLPALCESGCGIGVFNEATVGEAQGLHAVPLPETRLPFEERLYALWAREGENSEAVRRLRVLLGEREAAPTEPAPEIPAPAATPPSSPDPATA